jgi:hypothetical protein
MRDRLSSWWQQIKQHRVAFGVVGIGLAVVISLVFAVVWFNGTGFDGYTQVTTAHTISGPSAGTVVRTEVYQPGKSLWDWLQLLGVLAIPVVVGFGVAWFAAQQGKVSDRENTDNQRETALQAYINSMSELLLHEKLRKSGEDDEVRKIARVRTLTVLPRLDGRRKGSVLQFLYESGLLNKDKKVIDLTGANLTRAILGYTNLTGANLTGANLTGANLTGTSLTGANLTGASLSGASLGHTNLDEADLHFAYLDEADLSGAMLHGADLSGADLTEATGITTEQLEKAKSLSGTIMPDGTPHP